jgi:hypothetical protein
LVDLGVPRPRPKRQFTEESGTEKDEQKPSPNEFRGQRAGKSANAGRTSSGQTTEGGAVHSLAPGLLLGGLSLASRGVDRRCLGLLLLGHDPSFPALLARIPPCPSFAIAMLPCASGYGTRHRGFLGLQPLRPCGLPVFKLRGSPTRRPLTLRQGTRRGLVFPGTMPVALASECMLTHRVEWSGTRRPRLQWRQSVGKKDRG